MSTSYRLRLRCCDDLLNPPPFPRHSFPERRTQPDPLRSALGTDHVLGHDFELIPLEETYPAVHGCRFADLSVPLPPP